jgi:hypothetical protein
MEVIALERVAARDWRTVDAVLAAGIPGFAEPLRWPAAPLNVPR